MLECERLSPFWTKLRSCSHFFNVEISWKVPYHSFAFVGFQFSGYKLDVTGLSVQQ